MGVAIQRCLGAGSKCGSEVASRRLRLGSEGKDIFGWGNDGDLLARRLVEAAGQRGDKAAEEAKRGCGGRFEGGTKRGRLEAAWSQWRRGESATVVAAGRRLEVGRGRASCFGGDGSSKATLVTSRQVVRVWR